MRVAWRATVVLAVFVGVGFLTEHWRMMHGLAAGRGPGVVRPAAWGTGLFAGGVAAAVAAIAVWWKR